MTMVTRFDPLHEMISLREAMNRLFEQSVVRPLWHLSGEPRPQLPLDVYESEQGYVVRALVPGVRPDDIGLEVQGQSLLIRVSYPAAVEEGRQVHWLLHEIGSGPCERVVTFERPIDSEKVEARCEHGLLTIIVPVVAASRPRRISVTAAEAERQPEPQLVTA
ncbi:Hsp20/alpha crystallin family protein [Thermogemmatispora sp.]|uniref:Hsp20/alpha crystallin family protein n=1 Tax=Thermogemmatispora sp. TaxID=1968838 RepID=UPI001D8FF2A9|nr:Hsp20/alpha crystallin family protein [Thermogemmatispora sp.]MBX5448451.1 Hsp20/alpha crystallin family protein [Thermogemmatispora sp.]